MRRKWSDYAFVIPRIAVKGVKVRIKVAVLFEVGSDEERGSIG
jgi:hypothetical protein